MKINSSIKELCFDKRIVEWGLQNKDSALSSEKYKKHLESLPDLSAEKDPIVKESTDSNTSSE